MRHADKKVFRCFLKTLSPIHIGCDEVYEPTGFTLDEQAQQMIVFDPLLFISKMDPADKRKFSEICSKGTISSILEIYKFMQNTTAQGRRVDVCNDFFSHYRDTLSIPLGNEKTIQQELNKFSIPRTAFSPADQHPYIPGSSIKGALRTAYLNSIENEKKLSQQKKRYKPNALEKELMNYDGIPTDPFRMVKVSDFRAMGEIRTKVVYGVNEKKSISKHRATGLPLLFEVIQPGALFEGMISVETPLPGAKIRKAVSLKNLLESSRYFYKKEKQREDTQLARIGATGSAGNGSARDQTGAFLIRIGRHCGAESVTIAGHRDIKIMTPRGEKPKYLDHATTLWLASEVRKPKAKASVQPFGWAQLTELTDDLATDFQSKEQAWKAKKAEEQEIRQAEERKRLELQRQAVEAAERRALEKEKGKKEAEKREAELAAMSPEERELAAFEDSGITEEQVNILFSRLDEFSDENKPRLARSLKDYWMANRNWTKKDVGQKQWKKIRERNQKIDGILGDV